MNAAIRGLGKAALNNYFGVMVASNGETTVAVPLEEVAGNRKTVPPNHAWIKVPGKLVRVWETYSKDNNYNS